jgi:hypothetical protein
MKPGLVADFPEVGVGDRAQQVWSVPLTVGAATCCARPVGETRPVLNADTPELRTEYIQTRLPRLAKRPLGRLAG